MSKSVSLQDKYELESDRAYLSGIQALVRLPLLQRARDRAAGLNTAGFISGYRGSPLGGYDQALWSASEQLGAEQIIFKPGMNEDLACTAVWGSQQVGLFPGAQYDGVFGIWYAKAPGVDRSMDVLKHANASGTSPRGGVLAILGDDHAGVSSTLVSQSEQLMIAAMMPVLNPSNVQEYLRFGLLGFALSRFSGCWVGFKAISETVESAVSAGLDISDLTINLPGDFRPPADGLHIRLVDNLIDKERRLLGPKMEAVAAFTRVNSFDRLLWSTPRDRFSIVTTGKAYLDVREALALLGIGEAQAAELGLSVYKVGLSWPLETTRIIAATAHLERVLVVEEKQGIIEGQLTNALFNLPRRPIVIGKADLNGQPLILARGPTEPLSIAQAVMGHLLGDVRDPAINERYASILTRLQSAAAMPATTLNRSPFFCSGCPHNRSTKLPDGSRAGAGIGCHGMAGYQPDTLTSLFAHMGGEGANWIGQAPFTSQKHIFQNLGDGTYFHSGAMAIRAAKAAGVNITFKILYNDAVAMTGGQPIDGTLTVGDITRQVLAEGANIIYVLSDEPEKYGKDDLAPGSIVRHRDALDEVQRQLRDVSGLSVLVYDQTCAAEKRRRRKRGLYPDPPQRVFINHRVCEGCGDCSEKSNCVAVKPIETAFGRKRQIDQSDCNKDFSCLEGFCPSFVTVENAAVRKTSQGASDFPDVTLPDPVLPALDRPYNMLVAGIGGSGVLTIGALIGMAAHIEGRKCSVLDNTGLAQKNGSVTSHIRIGITDDEGQAVRVPIGGADVLIGCDPVVAASAAVLSRAETGRTIAVVNDHLQPTADFVRNNDIDFESFGVRASLKKAIGDELLLVNATRLATALCGDAIATNIFLLGFAWQKGLVPLAHDSIAAAIQLNGVAIDANLRTFKWGRIAAVNPNLVETAAGPTTQAIAEPKRESLGDLVERFSAELTAYQDERYAARFRELVDTAVRAEAPVAMGSGFAEAVARGFYKLLAYKDEYEVARLYTDEAFMTDLQSKFEPGFRLRFHLAPPAFARRDRVTGHLRKSSFGPWMMPAFRLLARLRWLRGTPFDPFGRTQERREERALIAEYEETIRHVARSLSAFNRDVAMEIARVPHDIRGYGHVKEKKLGAAKTKRAALLKRFNAPEEAMPDTPNRAALA
jgi:indolepyruvate ferredoxin oxidoreductase